MGSTAIVFSGQGAQYPGMGRELYEYSPAARFVFDMAEKIKPGITQMCFSGTDDELRKTENTQPCLYCVDLAAAAALEEAGVRAEILAGFSLGELAALAFSGAVSYEAGFEIVLRRAELMRKASERANTGMAAVLTLSDDEVTALCGEYENVYPVNFNYKGQVVVSGLREELELFISRVKETGGKAVPLKVSGAFHSPFMAEAAGAFTDALGSFEIGWPRQALYANVSAQRYGTDARDLLARQVCNPVLWSKSVENMIAGGADTFIEAGPGRTLCGFISRISKNVRVFNVEDCESLQKTVEGVISRA